MRLFTILIGCLALTSACAASQGPPPTVLAPLEPRQEFTFEGKSTATTTPIRLRGDYLVAWSVNWDNASPDQSLYCVAYLQRLDGERIGEDATYAQEGFPIFEFLLLLNTERLESYRGSTQISDQVDGPYGITTEGLADTDYVLDITAFQPPCTYSIHFIPS